MGPTNSFAQTTPYEWHEVSSEYDYDFEQMVQAVTDYDDYNRILPYVDKMRVISRRGPESICYFERFIGAKTFWMQVRFKVAETTLNTFKLKVTYLDGNAHPYNAEIIVERVSSCKTRVTARMKVESPGPVLFPDSLINHYVDHFLAKSHKNLERYLNGPNR